MSNINPEVLKTLSSNALLKVNQGNKRTHSFNVEFTEYREDFTGKFTVHYPSQLERMKIGVVKSGLLGGALEVDTMTDNIAHIISTLDVVLDEKPEWFNVDNPDVEYEILYAVFREYQDWINSFRNPTKPSDTSGDSEE